MCVSFYACIHWHEGVSQASKTCQPNLIVWIMLYCKIESACLLDLTMNMSQQVVQVPYLRTIYFLSTKIQRVLCYCTCDGKSMLKLCIYCSINATCTRALWPKCFAATTLFVWAHWFNSPPPRCRINRNTICTCRERFAVSLHECRFMANHV